MKSVLSEDCLIYDMNYGGRAGNVLIMDCWPDDILQRLEAWKSIWTKKKNIVFIAVGENKEEVFSVLKANGYKMTRPDGGWWERLPN